MLFFILGHFLPFYSRKNENFKKWKKHQEISSFYTTVLKIMIICCTVLEIWHMTDVVITFHFRPIFCSFTPLTAQKFKILKKWKKSLVISSFTNVYQKLWSDDARFPRHGVRQTDGKSDILRSVPHLKSIPPIIQILLKPH